MIPSTAVSAIATYGVLKRGCASAILPFYALGVASIFVFRRRTAAEYSPPFRAPLYPIAPILFVLATLYLLVNALIDPSSRWATLAIFGVILAGIPVYYATVGGSAARAAAE